MELKANKKENAPPVTLLPPVITSFRHVSKPWGVFTSISGLGGDFLKPSIDIAPYFILLSFVGFILSFFFFRKKAKQEGVQNAFNSKLGGFITFSALSLIGWILLFIFYSFTPPRGVSATLIPGVADLQNKLLKISEDVSEIKKTTSRIEEKIDALSKTNVIISNPQEPAEFYHNAKFYEIKGNIEEAKKSYEKFLELAPNYVDVHQAYQNLLNNTEGVEVTLKTYEQLLEKYPGQPIVALMAIRLLPNHEERLMKLRMLSEKYPKIAPIFLELAQEYFSSVSKNSEDLYHAKAAILQYKKLEQEGVVKNYYLDKNNYPKIEIMLPQ